MISVIIPFRGDWSLLAECIDSLITSELVTEILIGVDGSIKDQGGKLFSSTKYTNVQIIEFESGPGVPHILNSLFSVAKNEYIARMDADDKAKSNRFIDQVMLMTQKRELGILGGNIILKHSMQIPHRKNGRLTCKDFFYENPIAHPTVMFRKSTIKKIMSDELKLYNVKFTKAQDYELWLRAVRKVEVYNCESILVIYNEKFSFRTFLWQHLYFTKAMLNNLIFHFVYRQCTCKSNLTAEIIFKSLDRIFVYPFKVLWNLEKEYR